MPKAPTLPMMPLWVRDHISATRCFTLAERGAYMDLLMFSWDMGPLPSDPKRLALTLGVGVEEFTVIWSSIAHKFVENAAGLLMNERLEQERTKSLEMRARAAVKASMAANKRWAKDAPSNAPSINSTVFPSETMLGAMLEQCPPSPSASLSPSAAPAPSKRQRVGGGLGEPLRRRAARVENAEGNPAAIARVKKLMAASPDLKDHEVAKIACEAVGRKVLIQSGI